MGKLFDWLGGVLNPTGEKPESRKVSEGSPVLQGEKDTPSQESGSLGHFTDAQDVQDTISECLVREMGMYRGGSGYPDLTLWIDDPIASLLVESLQERLKKDLLHSGCRPLNPKTCVTVREGAPAEGVKAVALSRKGKLNSGKVFLSFALEKASDDKAVISVYWGKGSLMASSYEIDPSVKPRYRIGRGETSSRPDYSFRVNDIVIRTDDPEADVQALNNHVSSAHADLVFREGRFYLQVLPSGSVSGNNSTRIIRDQIPIPVEQPGIDYPLRDGDLIELGGTVLLQFKSIS